MIECSGEIVNKSQKESQEIIRLLPTPRETIGKVQKTIILVRGKPNIGKTTLCSHLIEQSEKIGYISFDLIADNLEWCTIMQLHEFRKTLEYPSRMIDKVNEFIDQNCAIQFVKHAFKKFINPNLDDYILIDGHFFSLKNNYQEFVKRCRKYNYRLWVMDRVV